MELQRKVSAHPSPLRLTDPEMKFLARSCAQTLTFYFQEVHDMAEYLGINIVTEGFLLPLAKMSLQARAND